MTQAPAHRPTIFETTQIAPDDPLLERPLSNLPLDRIVEAARIVTAFPGVAAVQRYRRHVVSLRITAEEFDDLLEIRAHLRLVEMKQTPSGAHLS